MQGLTGDFTLTAGSFHTVTMRQDGTGWVWGRNNYGQLGDGTTSDRSSLVPVTVLEEDD